MDFVNFQQNRSNISDLTDKDDGKEVVVAGWLYDQRDLGNIRFILLRDITGEIQVTAFKNKTDSKVFDSLNSERESVLFIKGKVKKSDKAPGGREISPEDVFVLAKAEQPLPIDVSDFSKTELPKRLDFRFLDLHRNRTQAIFKIQNSISNIFRKHFFDKGFIEMQPPCVISAASEGGTELFPVQYFEKKAYLAQSPQLYKQMLACSMEKIFMITPVWRAEKHNTTRHINEIRQMDIEMAFADQFVVMKHIEEVVREIVQYVLENNKKELEVLGIKDLKVPNAVYLHYTDAIKKVDGTIGDDFTGEQEKKLCAMYPGDIVFTHSWPSKIKPFYIMPKGEDFESEESCGFDALFGGIEISSGGQRIHLPELLTKMIQGKGLNPESFKSYIDSFRYGAPPHAGWSIGLERLTQIICGLDNIKEATMFPRDRDRLTP